MSSEQIYYTYYSPTDWHHPNKVKYTENLSNAGDLLVTSSSGFENLNARDVIPTYWNGSNHMVNDYNYNISITNGFKYMPAKLGDIQYVAANSNIAHTIAKQITIDDFDYDTVFGLTLANPNVIDYNWYSKNNGKNIFGNSNDITNKETTRIGPKLFLYKGGTNNYKTGDISDRLTQTQKINSVTTDETASTYNNILSYKNQILTWSNAEALIDDSTTFYDAEEAWPYKIQYNPNQWYHILTNGQKSALLTLPYWDSSIKDLTNVDPERYYVLNVKKDKITNDPIYSYYKLDKIVENNYYYITSFFDTRPTLLTSNAILFNSNSSSLFNENTIQILPLVSYDYNTFYILHKASSASCVASCVPLSYTTSREPKDVFIGRCCISTTGEILDYTKSDSSTVNYENANFGLNPIEIKYEKNITITTTINYTIANMTNLSNTLTGWNYLHKNFITPDDINKYDSNNNYVVARANLPYINAGIIIYIPTDDTQYYTTNNNKEYLNNDSAFIRFRNWIEAFGFGNFYSKTTETSTSGAEPIFNEKFKNIYNTIFTSSGNLINVGSMSQNSSDRNFFYKLSTPAFINFNTAAHNYMFDDYIIKDGVTDPSNYTTRKYDFLNINGDDNVKGTIKFVNTLCMPINNAINTTHTATDNFTFRLQKINNSSNYYYIIGIYFYITKGVPFDICKMYPHYLGFSPSTNIAPDLLMTVDETSDGDTDGKNAYLYPHKTIKSFLCDSADYTNVFNGVNFPYKKPIMEGGQETYPKQQNALMKDTFITPSIYMTLNESVGDV